MLVKMNIQQLSPYIPGFQPKLDKHVIKLNSNENPYPPSLSIQKILKEFDIQLLRYYPNSVSQALREAIASAYNVDYKRIFCGNGSDEIISLIFTAFLEENDTIVTPYPTYTVYKAVADIHKVHCLFIQTNDDFTIDVEKLLAPKSNAIFIANPNAPTGLLLPPEKIQYILEHYNGLVVIDEAYIDFAEANASSLQFLEKYPNIMILRTFSKSYSLCGARVGYCFADPILIHALDKCKDSYNINHISQLLALAAVEDQDYFRSTVEKIVRSREYLANELGKSGFEVVPSQTNFLLCSPKFKTAKEVYDYLVTKNIYIRYFDSSRIDDKLRITVGTEHEIDQLLKSLVDFKEQPLENRHISVSNDAS